MAQPADAPAGTAARTPRAAAVSTGSIRRAGAIPTVIGGAGGACEVTVEKVDR
jgi:hypothetical protein